MGDRAQAWLAAGQFLAGIRGEGVEMHSRSSIDAWAIPRPLPFVLLHGFPTRSYDFHLLASDLSADHYVCLFDFPGYGFSDKPLNGYTSTLRDDARLVDFFVQQIVSLQRLACLHTIEEIVLGWRYWLTFPLIGNSPPPLRITF
jgi:pimeloyl-ACP methyl ester carboxylesterase